MFWNISSNDISVLFSQNDRIQELDPEQPLKASNRGVMSGPGGRITGTGAQINQSATPSIGATGPIMVKLSNTAFDAPTGGVDGILKGMDIPKIEAQCYRAKIKAGNLLICVNAENAQEMALARDIFTQSQAENISSADEAPTNWRTKPNQAPTDNTAEATRLQRMISFLRLG